MHDGRQCGKTAIRDSQWCIFHYPDKPKDLFQSFKNSFDQEYEIQMMNNLEYLDFSGFDFPIEMNFMKKITKKIYFDYAHFREEVNFGSYESEEVISVVFSEDISFNHVVFLKVCILFIQNL